MIPLLWVRRVPTIIWIVLGVAGSLGVAFAASVRYGEHKVERAARKDSVRVARAVQNTVRARVDTLIRAAATTKAATVTTGVTRTHARARVAIVNDSTVTVDGVLTLALPALVELVRADDAKIAADSAHIAPLDSLPHALLVERNAGTVVQALLSTEADDHASVSHGHGKLYAVGGAVVAVAAIALLRHH